mgnify:FL=1
MDNKEKILADGLTEDEMAEIIELFIEEEQVEENLLEE